MERHITSSFPVKVARTRFLIAWRTGHLLSFAFNWVNVAEHFYFSTFGTKNGLEELKTLKQGGWVLNNNPSVQLDGENEFL